MNYGPRALTLRSTGRAGTCLVLVTHPSARRLPPTLGRIKSRMPPLSSLLARIVTWATHRNDIVGLALVGSPARGTARPDSDVDLIVLTPQPGSFRESQAWLAGIDWSALGLSVKACRDAVYGAVWSRHVELSDRSWVEFGFARIDWAATRPCDPGTRCVVSGGCRVLYDPVGLLESLLKDAA